MKQVKFEISRRLSEQRASVNTICNPGMITVLVDEAADGILHHYSSALEDFSKNSDFTFLLDGRPANPNSCLRVGFGERLEDLSITQYLLSCGYAIEETEKVIETFDLEQYNYLNCCGLNSTATRQLELLGALKSEKPVIVCNDPFLPFSGRWREEFARLVSEFVAEKNVIFIVTNLSFMPQTWVGLAILKSIDVGKAAEKATKQAKEAEARAQAQAQAAAAAAAAAAQAQQAALIQQAADSTLDTENQPAKNPEHYIETLLPDNFKFAYRAVNDYLFTPLARISNIFREYSAFALPGAVVMVGLMIALIMYPNYKHLKNINANKEKVKAPTKIEEIQKSAKVEEQTQENLEPNVVIQAESDQQEQQLVAVPPAEVVENKIVEELALDDKRDPSSKVIELGFLNDLILPDANIACEFKSSLECTKENQNFCSDEF